MWLPGVEASRPTPLTEGVFWYGPEDRTAKLLSEPMILSSQSN